MRYDVAMPVRSFQSHVPDIAEDAYIDDMATVIGKAAIGSHSSVWPMAVIRGDVQSIMIGHHTNIQDASVIHVTHDSVYSPGGKPTIIGNYVTIGHHVMLHGCEIGDRCLVGMQSTVLDGAILEADVMVGAASLVPSGKRLESGYLYVGSPVKKVRLLTEKEREFLLYSATHYAKLKAAYLSDTIY